MLRKISLIPYPRSPYLSINDIPWIFHQKTMDFCRFPEEAPSPKTGGLFCFAWTPRRKFDEQLLLEVRIQCLGSALGFTNKNGDIFHWISSISIFYIYIYIYIYLYTSYNMYIYIYIYTYLDIYIFIIRYTIGLTINSMNSNLTERWLWKYSVPPQKYQTTIEGFVHANS